MVTARKGLGRRRTWEQMTYAKSSALTNSETFPTSPLPSKLAVAQ